MPCARVLLPWERQQLRTQFEYKRAEVTYDGHYKRCLSTEQGTENGFSEVYSVCWLCKSSRSFTLIKKIKNQRLTF